MLTNCSGETSFTALKRVKNYLRSTIVNNKFNSLSTIKYKNNKFQNIHVSNIINNFSENKARKKLFFLNLFLVDFVKKKKTSNLDY